MTMLTVKELAKELSVKPVTIDRLRKKGLPWVQVGHSVRFELEEVLVWLKNQQKEKEVDCNEKNEDGI